MLGLFSLSFSSGSVNNYHSTDRRKKVLDEVCEGSWSNLVTKCSFPLPTHCRRLAALSWLGWLFSPVARQGGLFSSMCWCSFLRAHFPCLLASRRASPTLQRSPELFFQPGALCGVSSVLPILPFEVPAEEHR